MNLLNKKPRQSNVNSENIPLHLEQRNAFYESYKLAQKEKLISRKRVLIIYTGGTIGMVKGDKGLKPKFGFLRNHLYNHPNFCDKEATDNEKDDYLITPPTMFGGRRIKYKIMEILAIDSSNMDKHKLNLIGQTVADNYDKYDSFIVLHGTDTMSYTACFLSFMLENINKTIIITGSQIPLLEIFNDSQVNLINAITIAGLFHIPEVLLMFNTKLFRGNRTIKNDNLNLDAFESPNFQPIAEIGMRIKINWDIILPSPTLQFNYFADICQHINIMTFFPMMSDESFQHHLSSNYKGKI